MSVAGPTIYLLPGLDGTGDLFGPLLQALAARAARAISYPFEPEATWETLTRAALDQIDPSEPFVLFAESFSGPVAMRLLSEHGSRCVGYLACATFLSNPAPRLLALSALPCVLRLVPRRPPAWAVRRLLLSRSATPALTRQVADTIARVPRRCVRRRLALIRALEPAVAAFDHPVIYLRGTEDRLVGSRSQAEFAANVPGTRVETLAGPHLLAQERPEVVARLLLDLCGS